MERKFKHKLTNKVIKIGGKTGLSCQTIIGNSNLILGDIIKGEDWELIVEKDYKILALARFCSIKPTITDVSDYGDEFIEAMLKCDKARIHSIKRKSDGEIFTIGDNIMYETNKFTINGFFIPNEFGTNTVCVSLKNYSYRSPYLNQISKPKQPLFTTEDGVDIFEGDDYYSIHTTQFNFPNGYGKPTIKGTAIKGYWITFSTKEAAEEYVLMNKPKYSLNDIMNAYDRANCSFIRRDLLQEELKKLNK